ncbi:MAG: hypothetical protein AAAC47_22950 [Pararhizobium sp.]
MQLDILRLNICGGDSRDKAGVLVMSPLTWEQVNLTGDCIREDEPLLDESGYRTIPPAL